MTKNTKKIFAATLIGAVLISNTVYAKAFSDVEQNGAYSWVYSSLDKLSNRGVFGGYPDNTFKPYRAVSFLEVMQVIKNIKNPSAEELKASRDKYEAEALQQGVPNWALESVCYNLSINSITINTIKSANEKGFLRAVNTVYPDRNSVTVYFGRAFGFDGNGDRSLLKHSDLDNVAEMTKGYLANLVGASIYSDTGSDGKFNGSSFIRRAEVAVIADRALTYLESNSKNDKKDDSELKIDDVSGIVSNVVAESAQQYGSITISDKEYKMNIQNVVVVDPNGLYNPPELSTLKDKNVSAKIKDGEIIYITILSSNASSTVNTNFNIVEMTGKVISITSESDGNLVEIRVLVSDSKHVESGSVITIKTKNSYKLDQILNIKGNIVDSKLANIEVN